MRWCFWFLFVESHLIFWESRGNLQPKNSNQGMHLPKTSNSGGPLVWEINLSTTYRWPLNPTTHHLQASPRTAKWASDISPWSLATTRILPMWPRLLRSKGQTLMACTSGSTAPPFGPKVGYLGRFWLRDASGWKKSWSSLNYIFFVHGVGLTVHLLSISSKSFLLQSPPLPEVPMWSPWRTWRAAWTVKHIASWCAQLPMEAPILISA